MRVNEKIDQTADAWGEAVIQSRFKLDPAVVARYKGAGAPNDWSGWAEIPAGPGTLTTERQRIKALRERSADQGREEQFRLILRQCFVIDYDLATGEPVGETRGG